MRRAVRAANFARSVTHRLSTQPAKTVRHVITDVPSPFAATALPQPVRQHLVGEDLFEGVVLRERRRAERSDEPFVLYLIEADRGLAPRSALLWRSTLDALAVCARETDVVGWFRQHAVIGVVLTGLDSQANVAREFDARLRCELGKRLHQSTIDRLSIRMHIYPEAKRPQTAEGHEPVLQTLAAPRRRPTGYDGVKRSLDLMAALTLLVLLSPAMLVVAALVKLRSKGPVLYKQDRIGQDHQPFKMLKFRTMHVSADPAIHQEFVTRFIKADGAVQEPGQSGLFKITKDPRIIPGGRFLRKTSLDELPQLWNVVRGEMSLVGPRPPLAYEVAHYKSWHCRRVLEVKPGVTGLWQVKGRSRTTFDEMVRLDLQYARTYSLWTDLKILLATPGAVIAGKGAV
jgi:lipopolysaccharide/colanic/teichoic acid biosynthesis glycosyltransferase